MAVFKAHWVTEGCKGLGFDKLYCSNWATTISAWHISYEKLQGAIERSNKVGGMCEARSSGRQRGEVTLVSWTENTH